MAVKSVGQRHKPKTAEPSALDVVNAFFDGVESRNFERAETLLSTESFGYEGFIEKHDNAADFIRSIFRFGSIFESVERRRMFVDGNEVCAILTYETSLEPIESVRIAYWLRVEGGRITRIESFFDARGYAEMFNPKY